MLAHESAALLPVIQPYLWTCLIALAVTVITTPIVTAIARKSDILDRPDTLLKPHAKPIPYLGGVAIYLGWATAIFATQWIGPAAAQDSGTRWMLKHILAAGTVMMLIGLVDDIRDLRPRTKLLCELIAAAILIHGRIGHDAILLFVGWFHISIPEWLVVAFSAVFTVLVLIGAGNATNLIDGLDGLCSGVTGIIGIGFAVIAAHLAAHQFSPTGDPVRLVVAFALFGACIAFLWYNFNPARIFMGDAGSLLLGFNAAVLLLLFAERGILRWFLGACMVFSLPVFDTMLAISRRWLNGRPIFTGDRSHFYDQLRDRGLSVRATVLICYALAAALAGIGCLVLYIRTRHALVVFLLVLLAAILAVARMGMLRVDAPRAGGTPSDGESKRKAKPSLRVAE